MIHLLAVNQPDCGAHDTHRRTRSSSRPGCLFACRSSRYLLQHLRLLFGRTQTRTRTQTHTDTDTDANDYSDAINICVGQKKKPVSTVGVRARTQPRPAGRPMPEWRRERSLQPAEPAMADVDDLIANCSTRCSQYTRPRSRLFPPPSI